MDDAKKKADPSNPAGPDEKWAELLGGKEALTGVTPYTGLMRRSPSDEAVYELYLSLDMSTCLHVQKEDVLHWEDLPADKSPFGSLGGCRVYVRKGATIRSVRTVTQTFQAAAGGEDDFDLDIRLGSRSFGPGGGGGGQTIPDTGCGAACETIPPFTAAGCSGANTFCNCTLECTLASCPCVPTQGGKTCGANCLITNALTCVTNCGTCATCQTNCGTCATNCGTCATNCGTCNTHCGTCRVNTCNTKCGQETCAACTHIFTQCNQNQCNP
jgi:hypothetical protein